MPQILVGLILNFLDAKNENLLSSFGNNESTSKYTARSPNLISLGATHHHSKILM